uniref:Uncharacterized protein n=1 Tax=Anguilla anguilla TaxID=7936 RepID=A0A0E9P6N4_ANGAN
MALVLNFRRENTFRIPIKPETTKPGLPP